jgi:hypothetical protein
MFVVLAASLAHAVPLAFEVLQGVVSEDRVTVTYRLNEASWTNLETQMRRSGQQAWLMWRFGDERLRTRLDGRTAVVTFPVVGDPVPATRVQLLGGDPLFDGVRYHAQEDVELVVPYGPPLDVIVRPDEGSPIDPEVVGAVRDLAAAHQARKDAKESLDPNDPTVKACNRLARNYGRVKCVDFAYSRPQGPREVQACARMSTPEKGQCYDWLRDKRPSAAGEALHACADTFGPKAALGCARRMDGRVRPRGDALIAACATAFDNPGDLRTCAKTLTVVPDAVDLERCAGERKAKRRLACLAE